MIPNGAHGKYVLSVFKITFDKMISLAYQIGKRLAIFSAMLSLINSEETFITVEAIKSLIDDKFNKNGMTKGSSDSETKFITQLLISDLCVAPEI